MHEPDPRRWRALAALALVQFAIVADNTIANVALPSIQADLKMPTSSGAWVINGYLLTAGGLVLLGGRLTDLLGRRRIFLVGTVLFSIASLACALAPTGNWLIAARFAQGCGEALASPAALSLIAVLFRDTADRSKALGIWGGLSGLGATAGVLLSGVLSDLLDWRWIFIINVPAAAVTLLVVPALVGRDDPRPATGDRSVDLSGAALVTGGATALVYGMLTSVQHGWAAPSVLACVVGGIAALVAFVVVERHSRHPLVPLGFFANRVRVGGNVAAVFLIGVMAALFLLLTLYLQQVRGYSALRSGLAYLPFCVVFVAAIGMSFLVTARIGSRATLLVAFGTAGAGMFWLSRLTVDSEYLPDLLPALLVLAVGFGFGFPGLQTAALHDVTEADAGLGAGVQTAVQALANALGVAAFLTVALRHAETLTGRGVLAPVAMTEGFAVAFLVGVGSLAVGAAVVAVAIPRRIDALSTPPAGLQIDIPAAR